MGSLSAIRLDPTSIISDILIFDEFNPETQPALVSKVVRALTDTAIVIDQLYHAFHFVVKRGTNVLVPIGYDRNSDILLVEVTAKLDKEREHFYSFILLWLRLLDQLRSAIDSDTDEECLLRQTLLATAELQREMATALIAVNQLDQALKAWKTLAHLRVIGQLALAMIAGGIIFSLGPVIFI